MQYRNDKYGNKISVLGYGCMRFSKNGGKIDSTKAEQEIMAAYENGVNYYDTAYIYPGSESALGTILERNGIRKKVYIATKLPHYMIKSKEDAEKYFQEELKRLRTDYVDYYLMHMLTDVKTWFTEKEEALLQEVVKALNEQMKVGCTGCGYCMPCPKNVDIPGTFAAYNKRYLDGKMSALFEYMMCTLIRKDATSASNCISCGKCEKHCSQHIEIRKELLSAKKELEGPVYKLAKKIVPKFMKL